MDFDGYSQAVIHLAWFRDNNIRHLLFGMVELRPIEFPDNLGCSRKDARAEKRSCRYLHYRRFVLPVVDAIEWYRNAVDGCPVLPRDPKHRKPDDAAKLEGGPFFSEPPWPHFVTSNQLVFAPDWMHGSRAHFLFPKEIISGAVRELIRVRKNQITLEEWLNFDIVEAYPEYQGAICMVAPNPVFRSINKSHLEQATGGSAETVAYKIVRRHGHSLNGLRLEINSERLRGRMAPLVHEFGSEAIVSFNLPAKLDKEGNSISHPKHGLLSWHEPLPLVETIELNIELHGRRKRVQVPAAGRKRPEYEYEVDELHDVGGSVVGSALQGTDVRSRLLEAEHRRSRKRSAKDYDQQWFHNAPSDAAEFVRQKISAAHHTVFIIDPFFAGRELLAFGHAIRRPNVQLRILISGKAFKAPGSAGQNAQTKSQLMASLKDTFKDYLVQPEIRVLPGQPPAVHDRFLIVDKTVWLSGNSLNTIGERAGMIVRLPDPEPVIERLEAFWRSARILSDWVSDRKAV